MEITVHSGPIYEPFIVELNFLEPDSDEPQPIYIERPAWLDQLEDQYIKVGQNLTYTLGSEDTVDDIISDGRGAVTIIVVS